MRLAPTVLFVAVFLGGCATPKSAEPTTTVYQGPRTPEEYERLRKLTNKGSFLYDDDNPFEE